MCMHMHMHTGREGAQAPGGWPGATLGGGGCGASNGGRAKAGPGVEKDQLQWGESFEAFCGKILAGRVGQYRFVGSRRAVERPVKLRLRDVFGVLSYMHMRMCMCM